MKRGTVEIITLIFVLFVSLIDLKISLFLALLIIFIISIYDLMSVRKGLYGLNAEKKKNMERNLRRVRDLIKQNIEVTNNDVEKALSVSNATASNYLEELEKRGEVIQSAKTGRAVVYTKRD